MLKKAKERQTSGIEELMAEELKQLDTTGADILYTICCKIWNFGKWPTECRKSIFVPIKKKKIFIGQ